MTALGWLAGSLALFYAGMVVLGAWIAHEMNKNREMFTFRGEPA